MSTTPSDGPDPAPARNAGKDISDRHLSLDELAELTGMTARNVRAYQQRGLMDPPVREGRRAFYTWDHLTRLRIVSALHEHGLTLRMIKDLLERGTANSELVRLGREEVSATWTRSVRVPMAEAVVEWVQENNPAQLEQLVASDVVERRGDRLFANATALGLTAAMSRQGLEPDVAARLALTAVEASNLMEAALLRECGELADVHPDQWRDEVELLMMQFAAVVFADHIHSAVIRHHRG